MEVRERVIEVEKTYRASHGQKAIDKFFRLYPELDYWKETFEYMLENGLDHFDDTIMGDGTKNRDWRYSLQFDDDPDVTYLCIIEREPV